MTKSTALAALLALLTPCLCNAFSPHPGPILSETIEPTPTLNKMPQVKYPAALVFEGGKGKPWFDAEGKNHTAQWRFYICLSKTHQPISKQTELKLSEWGTPLEVVWTDSNTHQPVFIERLNKVVLNLTYETQLQDNPTANFGNAWGSATAQTQSEQSWDLVYTAPDRSRRHTSLDDEEMFNINITSGQLGLFGVRTYEVNEESYYISRSLDRFIFSEKSHSHIIEACERADEPFVLLRGDEIQSLSSS